MKHSLTRPLTTSLTTASDPAVIDQTVIDGLRALVPEAVQAQAFLNDLIQTFLDSGAATVAALQATLDLAEPGTLAKQAHRLKGIGLNIGATRLSAACAELEAHAGKAQVATVAALCARIGREFSLSCAELRAVHYRAP